MQEKSDAAQIEKMWEELSKPLKRFIKLRVKSDQDAEDILQNVFYKIQTNIGGLRDVDKLNSWIYTIAKNSIADFYRIKKFETEVFETPEELASVTDDESTANEEIAQCLKSMIMYLPEKYKEAILLTEYHNLTQKELGERTGLSASGAKSRVQRARGKLKEMLLCCCQLEFDRRGNVVDYKHKSDDCKFC
ncbi:RNA polymerase sigma factor SigZ [Sinanaerobacter chloroacetimidivorans]|nr:RNA polymerase sigma factor SigZ [Sinanaerobacter chloroacetimidivorans]